MSILKEFFQTQAAHNKFIKQENKQTILWKAFSSFPKGVDCTEEKYGKKINKNRRVTGNMWF